MAAQHLAQVTASGPPLNVLLSALRALRDARMAAPGHADGRAEDHARLRAWIDQKSTQMPDFSQSP